MGLIKVSHPQTKEVKMLDFRGFDILGFIDPFLRSATLKDGWVVDSAAPKAA